MLHAHRKRRNASQSPDVSLDRSRPSITIRPPSDLHMTAIGPGYPSVEAVGVNGGANVDTPDGSMSSTHGSLSAGPVAAGAFPMAEGAFDYYMRNLDPQSGTEIPLWLNEHNLGDASMQSHSLDAFILPVDFDQRLVPQIW